MKCNTGQVINLSSLYSRFQRLHDKRKPKGKRYALATILVGMFLAKLWRRQAERYCRVGGSSRQLDC